MKGTRKEINEFMKKADKDGDGKLDFQEFKDAVQDEKKGKVQQRLEQELEDQRKLEKQLEYEREEREAMERDRKMAEKIR